MLRGKIKLDLLQHLVIEHEHDLLTFLKLQSIFSFTVHLRHLEQLASDYASIILGKLHVTHGKGEVKVSGKETLRLVHPKPK